MDRIRRSQIEVEPSDIGLSLGNILRPYLYPAREVSGPVIKYFASGLGVIKGEITDPHELIPKACDGDSGIPLSAEQ